MFLSDAPDGMTHICEIDVISCIHLSPRETGCGQSTGEGKMNKQSGRLLNVVPSFSSESWDGNTLGRPSRRSVFIVFYGELNG